MFFKKAYLSFAALVSLSGAMADSPFGPASTAGLTIDDLQMNYYCGLGPRVQNQAYACFLFSGDIKKSMYEPFNTHGYMDSLGSHFALLWQGKTQSFATEKSTVMVTQGSDNCLDVAVKALIPGSAQATGPAQHFTACPASDLIPIS